jgi:hypothetical protein
MTDFLLVNGTSEDITDVNAGNDDVLAYSTAQLAMTNAELFDFLDTEDCVAAFPADFDGLTAHWAIKIATLGGNPGL